MTAGALLAQLTALDVRLAADGPNLRYTAPRGVLTPDLLAALRAHKRELLGLLRTTESGSRPRGRDRSPPSAACGCCRRSSWWRHAEHGHWICARCHPPRDESLVAARHEVGEARAPTSWTGGDAERLIDWFLRDGQKQIPTEPFNLAPWLKVVDPAVFRDSLLLDISCGADGPRARTGAIQEELERLRRFLDEEARP